MEADNTESYNKKHNTEDGGSSEPFETEALLKDIEATRELTQATQKSTEAVNEFSQNIHSLVNKIEITVDHLEDASQNILRMQGGHGDIETERSYKEGAARFNAGLDELNKRGQAEIDNIIRTRRRDLEQGENPEDLEGAFDLAESTVPEYLKTPTIKRIKEKLVKRHSGGQVETNGFSQEMLQELEQLLHTGFLSPKGELYKHEVRSWFEERIERLESVEQSFEEQQSFSYPLMLATAGLELDENTRLVGEEMKELYETRRIRQRMVRVWNLSLPDGIYESSQVLPMSVLRDCFLIRNDSNKPIVADTFQQFERLAEELVFTGDLSNDKNEIMDGDEELVEKRLKAIGKIVGFQPEEVYRIYDEKGKPTDRYKNLLDKAKDSKDAEIKNLYRHGGSVWLNGSEMLADEAIKILSSMESLNHTNKKFLKELKEKVWSGRFAGGLWSITLRAAKHNYQLNGTGDFFAARMLNLNTVLAGVPFTSRTKGVWDPEKEEDDYKQNGGAYSGKPFDYGYRDFFSMVLGKVKERPSKNLNMNVLERWGIEESGCEVGKDYDPKRIGLDGKPEKYRTLNVIKSLKDVDLSNREIWDTLRDEYGVDEAAYSTHMFAFINADATRKVLLGFGKAFHTLDLEKFLKLGEVFEQFPMKEKVVDFDVRDGKVISTEGSSRQRVFRELLDRVIEFGKTRKGALVIDKGEWNFYPQAYTCGWIAKARESGMINSEQARHLMKKHLDIKGAGWLDKFESRKWLGWIYKLLPLERRVGLRLFVSMGLAPLRSGEMRQWFFSSMFWEILKQAFNDLSKI